MPAPERLRELAILLVLLALLAHALWAACGRVTAMDLWWLLSAGRYIVEHGTVPDQDVLSYTYLGAPWFNGEWLSQVVFFELYRLGGGAALIAFKTVVIVSVFFLLTWIGWRRSGSLVLGVACAVLTTYVCRPFFDVRSQLLLFLNLLTIMAILERYRRGGPTWLLALLPPVMIVWVNWHYSFTYGIGVLLLYAGAESLKWRYGLPEQPMPRQRVVRLVAVVAIAVLATLVNPYHLRALIEPFSILGREALWRGEIIEWMPPDLFAGNDLELNPLLFGYLLGLNLATATLAAIFDRRRFDLTDFLLVSGTAVMALSARRFIPLFALIASPFLAKNLSVVWARLVPRHTHAPELGTRRSAIAAAAAAVVAIAVLLGHAVPEARQTFAPGIFEGTIYSAYFPRGATEFLRINPLPARLFHPYTWGGYISFAAPGRQMFIDGRAHTVYPWRFYQESRTAENGEPGWNDVLDRWGVSVIVWPSGFASGYILSALDRFSQSEDWLNIYDDGHSAVFAHTERARPWVDAFRSLALTYPDEPGAQLFLAQAQIDAKQFAAARPLLIAIRSRWAEGRQSTEEAEEAYVELVRQNDDAEAWFLLGFWREVNGNRAAAAESFQEALARGLEDAEAHYARGALETGEALGSSGG